MHQNRFFLHQNNIAQQQGCSFVSIPKRLNFCKTAETFSNHQVKLTSLSAV